MRQIEQKKSGNYTSFLFEEDGLEYTLKDKNIDITRNIHYLDLDLKNKYQKSESNEWLRNAAIFWVVIGGLISISYAAEGTFKLSFWFPIGIACYAYYHFFSKITFTIVPSPKTNIYIIQDKNHPQIITEFQDRYLESLRKTYNVINYHNDPDDEIDKFNYLHREGAITKEEFENVIERIKTNQSLQETE